MVWVYGPWRRQSLKINRMPSRVSFDAEPNLDPAHGLVPRENRKYSKFIKTRDTVSSVKLEIQ